MALHAGLLLAMLVPLVQRKPPPTPIVLPEIINAKAIDQSQLDQALDTVRAREQKALEKQRQEELRRAQEQERAREAERIRIAKEKEERERIEREEKEKAEQEAEREREEQARKEAEEKKRQEEAAKKQREEEEKKRQLEEQERARLAKEKAKAELARALELEEQERVAKAKEAAQQLADQGEIEQYVAAITTKVQQNFVFPNLATDLSCTLYVKMLPTGDVIDARVTESSGDPQFDRQAILAVQKASPMPVPRDARLFKQMQEIRFIFDPQ